MLTTWGKKILSATPGGTAFYNLIESNVAPAFIEAKNTNGDTKYIPFVPVSGGVNTFLSNAINAVGSASSAGIAIGTDGHLESENDYTLGAQITGISGSVSSSTYYDTVNYKYVGRSTITINNVTENEITIREIGRFCQYNTATTKGDNASNTSNTRASIMIDRTVLQNPVVIASGDSAVIIYDFLYE